MNKSDIKESKQTNEFCFEVFFLKKIQKKADADFLKWREFRRLSGLLFALDKTNSKKLARKLEQQGFVKLKRQGVMFR